MAETYTVIENTSNFVILKQGCCGGKVRVPVSYGLVAQVGEDVDVIKETIQGLDVHRVFINGSWVEV